MACFWLNQERTSIEIPETEDIAGTTFYRIKITVGEVKWWLSRRYSEFYEFHSKLVTEHGVSKDILPSKKFYQNKSLEFVETRRQGLEEYCKKILSYFKRTMPGVFTDFFHFNVYDVFFLLQSLAFKINLDANLTSSDISYKLNPLELFAICKCLKNPFPNIECEDGRYDITHVFELCNRLKNLKVEGSSTNHRSSNINENSLPIDFVPFKVLESLILEKVCLENIQSVGRLRSTLTTLSVHNTSMMRINEILQCDVLHKGKLDSSQTWCMITEMNLTNNNLVEIDNTVLLVPELKTLTLDSNKISSITDLSSLHNLQRLSMANNLIKVSDQLHTKMGNIVALLLPENNITSLKGFSKLYSLITLDLASNKIVDMDEVANLGNLPCLENLILRGNPLTGVVDYRINVLLPFKDRAKDIFLDDEKPSQSELDRISVVRALKIVKEGKMPDLSSSFTQ